MSELFRADFGNTPLSSAELQGLIPSLTTRRELNEFEFANISSGRKWAMSPRRLAKAEILSVPYLLELHRQMFSGTWRWAGKIRTTEKTTGVPANQILTELGVLLGDVGHWIANEAYRPDEIAIRFHHGLVYIHPFPNGNGRHSRLAADILALKLKRPIFSWGTPVQDGEARRQEYLSVLKCAEGTVYGPLLAFARGLGNG